MSESDKWEARFRRERNARKEAESVLESKSRELYELNETLRKTLDQLEETVAERTAELRDAVREAEEASAYKSKFLATISHEIRTPINGVLGTLSLITDTALDPEQAKYVATCQKAADALLDLVNDLLDYTKLEADEQALESELIELKGLIDSVVPVLEYNVSGKGLSLDVGISDEVPRFIKSDSGKLRQVLLNLLGNAVKFTQKGGISVRVDLEDGRAGQILKVEVQDTGPGISQEDQEKLFAEFVTLTPSHLAKEGGTGLGLAICKRIVEKLGGEIGCRSTPGVGSVFWFTVPFTPVIAQEIRPVEATDTEAKEPSVILTNTRILVAEDNSANQLIAKTILEKAGAQVELASDGREAVDAFQARPFDLVLMDIGMPEMDGIEATRAIRALEPVAGETPVIAFTAHVMPGDREKLLGEGMSDFLSKPITKAGLLEAVQRHLVSKTQEADAQQPR